MGLDGFPWGPLDGTFARMGIKAKRCPPAKLRGPLAFARRAAILVERDFQIPVDAVLNPPIPPPSHHLPGAAAFRMLIGR